MASDFDLAVLELAFAEGGRGEPGTARQQGRSRFRWSFLMPTERAWRTRHKSEQPWFESLTSIERLVATVRERLASRGNERIQRNRMPEIRILFVDDEPDIREVMDVSLRLDLEIKTRACASGADALVTAAQWSPSSYCSMSGCRSWTVWRRWQACARTHRTAHIPVLFLTARMHERRDRALHLAWRPGRVIEPIDPMTLAASVRRHLPPSATHHAP